MPMGSRRAHSIACHPAQLLSTLLPLSLLPVQLWGGDRWKPLRQAGWGIGSTFPPPPTPRHCKEKAFPYKHALANALF